MPLCQRLRWQDCVFGLFVHLSVRPVLLNQIFQERLDIISLNLKGRRHVSHWKLSTGVVHVKIVKSSIAKKYTYTFYQISSKSYMSLVSIKVE